MILHGIAEWIFLPECWVVAAVLVAGAFLLGRAALHRLSRARRERGGLRLRAEFYEDLLERVHDAVCIVRLASGRFVLVNRRFEELFGIRREDLDSVSPMDLVAPEDRQRLAERFEKRRLGEDLPDRYEFRALDGNGEVRHVEVDTVPVLRQGEKLVYGICRDVTEQKELEARLRQTQTLHALGNLVGGMAHEFNNLIGGILGYASLTLARMEDDSLGRREVQKIADSARRAGDLVHRLIGYGDVGVEVARPVDLNRVLLDLAAELDRTLSPSVRIHVDLSSEPLLARGDESQLREVFQNLCENAADAMPRGGDLEIRSKYLAAPDAPTGAEDLAPVGPLCVVTICDKGEGMPPDVASRSIEPFYSTRDGHTGLGLSVAHAAIGNLDGFLEIHSEPGEGTEISVSLPAMPEVAAEKPEAQAVTFDTRQRTILVVDDDDVIRELAAEIFEDEGYRVLQAVGGLEALEVIRDPDAEIDLVILDLAMPGMTGQETLRRLREAGWTLPVIISSGFAGRSPLELCTSLGAQGFVPKPYDVDELLAAVVGALAAPTC